MKLQDIFDAAASILLSMFGALARQLYAKDTKAYSSKELLRGCIIASFIGLAFFFLTRFINVTGFGLYLIICISGWLGPNVLLAPTKIIEEKLLGTKLTKDEEDMGVNPYKKPKIKKEEKKGE